MFIGYKSSQRSIPIIGVRVSSQVGFDPVTITLGAISMLKGFLGGQMASGDFINKKLIPTLNAQISTKTNGAITSIGLTESLVKSKAYASTSDKKVKKGYDANSNLVFSGEFKQGLFAKTTWYYIKKKELAALMESQLAKKSASLEAKCKSSGGVYNAATFSCAMPPMVAQPSTTQMPTSPVTLPVSIPGISPAGGTRAQFPKWGWWAIGGGLGLLTILGIAFKPKPQQPVY